MYRFLTQCHSACGHRSPWGTTVQGTWLAGGGCCKELVHRAIQAAAAGGRLASPPACWTGAGATEGLGRYLEGLHKGLYHYWVWCASACATPLRLNQGTKGDSDS